MPCAARLGDQIIHSQALPQAKSGWWGGLLKGALVGAAIVAVSAVAVVATVGTGGLGAPFAIGAAAVIIGSTLRYGQVGFHEGAQQGALQGARAGPITVGSANVFINGKAAALACLSLVACTQHGDGKKVAQGSATVTLNGHRMARVGDGGECGFIIGEGSPNVFAGAPPASCHGLAVGSEIPQGLTDAVDLAGKIGGYMELVGGFVMGGPAILNAFKSLAGFASLAAVMGIGYGGSQLASDYAKQHGMSASDQMMYGDFGGLGASLLGGGMIAKGPGVFNGMKSGMGGMFEPGGMFGPGEPALAGVPRGFGSGSGPEIVPRAPGSPGMDAWNPPKNEPLQMSSGGRGTGGSDINTSRTPKMTSDGKVIPYGGTESDAVQVMNKGLAGQSVTKNGQTIRYDSNGFPEFTSKFDTQIPDADLINTRPEHFKIANKALGDQLRVDPDLAQRMGLTDAQRDFLLKDPSSGKAPPGLTWHHHQDVGKMQLVDYDTHWDFRHTGGQAIWGGGN